jgi:hypothetical protein
MQVIYSKLAIIYTGPSLPLTQRCRRHGDSSSSNAGRKAMSVAERALEQKPVRP